MESASNFPNKGGEHMFSTCSNSFPLGEILDGPRPVRNLDA